jgi:hypothetical protein
MSFRTGTISPNRVFVGLAGAILVGALLVTGPPATASCPRGEAARLSAELENVPGGTEYRFGWLPSNETWTLDSDDDFILELALIPFSSDAPSETTAVWMNTEAGSGYTFFSVTFAGGTTNPGGLTYNPNRWNNVRFVLDFESQTYKMFVNGQASATQNFLIPMGSPAPDDAYGPFFGLFNAGSTHEPAPAWLDSLRLRKRAPEGSEVLFSAQFEADPDFTPYAGSMDFMMPSTTDLAGDSCLTTTTVNVDKSANSIAARGRVTPNHSGNRLTVDLLKKKDGQFVKVDSKNPQLDENSRYASSFDRPANTNRCRIRTTFAFHFDHLGSKAQDTFDC